MAKQRVPLFCVVTHCDALPLSVLKTVLVQYHKSKDKYFYSTVSVQRYVHAHIYEHCVGIVISALYKNAGTMRA